MENKNVSLEKVIDMLRAAKSSDDVTFSGESVKKLLEWLEAYKYYRDSNIVDWGSNDKGKI